MGLPVALMAIAGGTDLAQGVAGASAAKQAAAAQQQQYNAQAAEQNYQAQITINNQTTATQNADVTMAAGEQQADNEGLKSRANAGAIKAGQAASGVDVNSGSAVDVQTSAREVGQLDALTVRSNAAREAYGYQVAASNYGAQAQADTYAGENDVIAGTEAHEAGDIAATSSILGSVSKAAGQAGSFAQAGGFSNPNPSPQAVF